MAARRAPRVAELHRGRGPGLGDAVHARLGARVLRAAQPARALEFAEDAFVLETGRIVLSGAAEDIIKDEGIRRSYLGY